MQALGDFGFRNTCTMQLPDLRDVKPCRDRPPQSFTVLPGLSQASTGSLAQNLPFELSEYGEQSGHSSSGRSGQIQSLGQRNEPDAEILEFLERGEQIGYRPAPAIQPPHQHHIDFAAARGFY